MKRTLCYALGILVSLVFILSLFILCMDGTATDESFFVVEYRKLSRPSAIGISEEDLLRVTDHLVRYMRGQEEDLLVRARINGKEVDVFGKRDRDHMVDVRNLYVFFLRFAFVGVVLAAAAIVVIALALRHEAPKVLSHSFLIGSGLFVVLAAIMGVWVAVDFSSFWTSFHHVFFTNDLWLLDPATSVLIQMVPQQFFFDIVVTILGKFAAVMGLLLLVCALSALYRAHRRKTLLAVKLEKEDPAKVIEEYTETEAQE